MDYRLEILCVVTAAAIFICVSADSVYYVSPDKTHCPQNTVCHDMAFYSMEGKDVFLHDNAVVKFLEGTHILTGMEMMEITNISNLTLQGPGGHSMAAYITCESSVGGMVFLNVKNLTISFLTFHNCGSMLSPEMKSQISGYTLNTFWTNFYGNSKHCILLADIMGLEMHQVTIFNCTGRGLSAVNAFDVDISEVDLSKNNLQAFNDSECYKNSSCFGGNMYFLYLDEAKCWPNEQNVFYLRVVNSSISFGINMATEDFSGGLGIGMYHSANYGVEVLIDSVILDGNSGYKGANLHFSIASSVLHYAVTLNNVTSMNGNAIYRFPSHLYDKEEYYFVSDETIIGGGIYYNTGLFLEPYCNKSHTATGNNKLTIRNSVFTGNIAINGGGAWIGSRPCDPDTYCVLKLENVTISDNSGVIGSGLSLQTVRDLRPEYWVYYILSQVQITNNNKNTMNKFHSGALYISQCQNVTIVGLVVANHEHSGIHLFNSDIIIVERDTVLENNTAVNGGGAFFHGSSHVILKAPGNLRIINNRAMENGGAIYVNRQFALHENPLCFFQTLGESHNIPNTHIYSFNNSAALAGDILYSTSGAIFNCSFIQRSYSLLEYIGEVEDVFFQLLDHDGGSDSTIIATMPVKACFCEDNIVNCSKEELYPEAFYGEYYNVSVATVGLFNTITPGSVGFTNHDRVIDVHAVENCTVLHHHFRGNHSDTIIAVDSTLPPDNRPLVITLSLRDCPPGFGLNSGMCECNEVISSSHLNIICNIEDQLMTRRGNNWIGYDSERQCTIIYAGCPLDYCNQSNVTFNISQPDPQCALNRAGTLCGQCAEGLSLLLGSNECKMCSNHYISLLVPFAFAGIVLVVLLIALNLTVAVGTINGLIFYANIVKMNESVLLQNQSIPVLKQFYSWITLDLGIPTCFFDGLDQYYKTWLQYAFPLYIWCIIIVIIVLANRYKWIAKLVGDNPVSVLATLLLLSYTKILRTIILAMHVGHVSCGNKSSKVIWLQDPSIEYFDFKHGILFLVAVLVFIFICIPFTLIHLLIRVIERHVFKYPILSRIHMITKPYFDAVGGPYKDECRFWGGFLLLVRLVLALIIPFVDPSTATSVILAAVIIVMLCGWNLQGVYQKWYNNLLESWFLLNLGWISIIGMNQGSMIGVNVSVSLVFATFILIVVSHAATKLNKLCKKQKQQEIVSLEKENVKRKRRNTLTKVYNTTFDGLRKMSTSNKQKTTRRERWPFENSNELLEVKNRRESLLSISLLDERANIN